MFHIRVSKYVSKTHSWRLKWWRGKTGHASFFNQMCLSSWWTNVYNKSFCIINNPAKSSVWKRFFLDITFRWCHTMDFLKLNHSNRVMRSYLIYFFFFEMDIQNTKLTIPKTKIEHVVENTEKYDRNSMYFYCTTIF